MKKRPLLFLGFIIILIIIMIFDYNSLVDADEDVDNAKSQVINRLNQRQASITQLLAAVTGLQEHAEEIYDKIIAARQSYSAASTSGDLEGMIEADAEEVMAINQLLVVIEDNPDIEATDGFLTLMDNISALESSLAQARKDYNDLVMKYNSKVRKFPTVLYVSYFGFEKEKPYWRMNDGADEIPQIDFN